MSAETSATPGELTRLLYRPHPWHGIPVGEKAPERVNAYIEIVPTDTVKYELDKETGYLKVDRPQKFSNVYPTLYGFIPRTYCGEENGAFCAKRTGREGIVGDGDPLDICVLSEKDITHGDVIVEAVPIGGLRMIDGHEADDKIIAVLEGDAVYGLWREVSQMPPPMLERLKHYFLTYKAAPDALHPHNVEIPHVYGREEAYEVIRRSRADYERKFEALSRLLAAGSGG
ncbi:inorganic pyrophosphatase [Acidobacteria bacterium ACD]|nr:MAG: inorganic pyrophosphatase [Acidobacteriota bacterium]MCE7960325.1 inorganic pyrophosphatase [Acidobacteria bacterium ACB2]MDL1951545.1 inorganic pyrophosphatase [Acidobacteria bacterium ACD]